MKRDEWTLLAIAAAKRAGLSPVQIQKALFLLGKRLPSEVGPDFYQFEPYNYGPFDVQVYKDAERLAQAGLVSVVDTSEHRWKQYQPTAEGIARAADLRQHLTPRAAAGIVTIVEWTQQQTFRDLVRAIYAEFPEYRVNSVFKV